MTGYLPLYKDGDLLGWWPADKAVDAAAFLEATIGVGKARPVARGKSVDLPMFRRTPTLEARRKQVAEFMARVRQHVVDAGGECSVLALPVEWRERVRGILNHHAAHRYSLSVEGLSPEGGIKLSSILRAKTVA